MILRAYSIYDCKALQYHAPWFQHTDAMAVRALQDLVNDRNTIIGRHPKDYSLWMVGTWDDSKGQFLPVSPNLHIIDAVALVADPAQGTLPLVEPERAGLHQPTPNGKDA